MKQALHSKPGERIGINDLLKYLKTNKEAIKNIGCVDLNNVNNSKNNAIDTEIVKLQFQDLKKMNYLPDNLASIFKINSDNFHKYLHAGVLQNLSYSLTPATQLLSSYYPNEQVAYRVPANAGLMGYDSGVTCYKQNGSGTLHITGQFCFQNPGGGKGNGTGGCFIGQNFSCY